MKKTFFALFCLLTGLVVPAQAQSTNTNSVVRFRLLYGGNRYGDIDVELFDQDKPNTVSNFLAYVQTRRYDNTILSRLLPGFAVQGGEYTVANPFSTSPFSLVTRIPTFGDITNEFASSTLRSNVFGTLAMAKVPGNPDSANSVWFFNLANNSTNLDTQDGGATVFGQVKSGQNVLTSFNGFGLNHGILNTTSSFHTFLCAPVHRSGDNAIIPFSDLPVAYDGQFCPTYATLFTVQMIQLRGPDVVGPKITITAPAENASLTNDNVLVRGTAIDNVGVASVRVYLNTNSAILANGTNSWSLTLTNVPPGTNTIDIEAADIAGNSTRLSRSWFHSVRVPLTLLTVGAGKITGATNGQLLELTRPYTLTARPDPGNLFGVWTGSLTSAEAVLKFNMESNAAFTAIFATNLFPYVKGVYNGLFYDTNQVDQQSSGFITLTLGDLGAYSGKLLRNGRTIRISGSFSADGGETNAVAFSAAETNQLLMQVDLTGSSDQITGSVTSQLWRSELILDRAVFLAKTNPAPLAGNYTFLWGPDTNAVPGAEGVSSGTLKVDAKGGVTMKASLADNTSLTLKTAVSKNGALPVYGSLSKGLGTVVSWLMFDTNLPDTDVSGLLSWFKKTQPASKIYPGGFTNEVMVVGSRFTAPTTNRVLNLTNAMIGFTNGNLAADFANDVTLGPDQRVTNNSTNALTVKIQKTSGLFTGSVTPPGGRAARSFKGALLQKQNRGAGFLLGTNRTSQVTLEEP